MAIGLVHSCGRGEDEVDSFLFLRGGSGDQLRGEIHSQKLWGWRGRRSAPSTMCLIMQGIQEARRRRGLSGRVEKGGASGHDD